MLHVLPLLWHLLVLHSRSGSALSDGLAITPPMGYVRGLLLACCRAQPGHCWFNIALKAVPQNPWNTYRANFTEQLARIAMDLLAADFAPAGYTYIFLDGTHSVSGLCATLQGLHALLLTWDRLLADAWDTKARGDQGELVPDPMKFGDGIHKLAAYAHQKGMPSTGCCLLLASR